MSPFVLPLFVSLAVVLGLSGLVVLAIFLHSKGWWGKVVSHVIDNTHFYIVPVAGFVLCGACVVSAIILGQVVSFLGADTTSGKTDIIQEVITGLLLASGGTFLASMASALTGFFCSQWADYKDWATKPWQEKVAYYAFVLGTLFAFLWFLYKVCYGSSR